MPLQSKAGNALGRLILLAPFGLALAAHAVGSTPSPMPSLLERPSLAFQQYMVDLGPVPPTDQTSAHFRFTNAGTEPVTVRDPQVSCGCLKPALRKKVLQPGEWADLTVRVRTANVEPGAKEYTIDVPYVDTKPHTAHLVFRCTLPPKQVLVKPRALVFYQLSDSGESTVRELEVIDQRERPLTVLSASSTSPLAKVETLSASANEDGQAVQRVRVTVSGKITGRHEALVHVKTNDPKFKELIVPLIIEGPTARTADRKKVL